MMEAAKHNSSETSATYTLHAHDGFARSGAVGLLLYRRIKHTITYAHGIFYPFGVVVHTRRLTRVNGVIIHHKRQEADGERTCRIFQYEIRIFEPDMLRKKETGGQQMVAAIKI